MDIVTESALELARTLFPPMLIQCSEQDHVLRLETNLKWLLFLTICHFEIEWLSFKSFCPICIVFYISHGCFWKRFQIVTARKSVQINFVLRIWILNFHMPIISTIACYPTALKP